MEHIPTIAYEEQSRASVIKVKAALQTGEGSSPEIRRFSVTLGDRNEAYGAVLKAVRSVFSVATGNKCSLFWKDDDDDLVRFSTSEELRHAIDIMHDDTLRLYVNIAPDLTHDDEVDLESDERHIKEDAPQMTSAYPPPPFAFHPPPPPLHPNHHHPLRPHHHFLHRPWTGPGSTGFEFPCGKKGKKMAKKMWKIQKKIHKAGHKEFMKVGLQVPEEFRKWVRDYVHAWFQQGGRDAAQVKDRLPSGLGLDTEVFGQWLHALLAQWMEKRARAPQAQEGPAVSTDDGPFMAPPEGLPPSHYRWLCLFLQHYAARHLAATPGLAAAAETAAAQDVFSHWQGFGHHGWRRCNGRACGKWKSRKFSSSSSSSSSESDSDSDGEYTVKRYRVPIEFRKYVRSSMKLLHKNKGGQAANSQEKATLSGLTPDVTDFVRQLLLEWHAKLSNKSPQVVALEMMSEERNLPVGLQREDFQWLCRFTARWHRRHAAKCDIMANWSSGSSSDEDVDARKFSSFGPWSRHRRCQFRAAMKAIRTCPFGAPHFGGAQPYGGPCHRGGPPAYNGAGLYPGVGLHFAAVDDPCGRRMGPQGRMGPPPPMYCFPHLYPNLRVPEVMTPSCPAAEGRQEAAIGQQTAARSRSTDDVVEQVTQGVKRM